MAQYSTNTGLYPPANTKLVQTRKQKPCSHQQLNKEARQGSQMRYHMKATALLPVPEQLWPVITRGSLQTAPVCSVARTQWEKKDVVEGQWGRVELHKSLKIGWSLVLIPGRRKTQWIFWQGSLVTVHKWLVYQEAVQEESGEKKWRENSFSEKSMQVGKEKGWISEKLPKKKKWDID